MNSDLVDSVACGSFWVSVVVLLIGLVFGFDVGSGLNFLVSVSSGKLGEVRNSEFDSRTINSLVCGTVDFGPALNGFGVDSMLLNCLDSVSCVNNGNPDFDFRTTVGSSPVLITLDSRRPNGLDFVNLSSSSSFDSKIGILIGSVICSTVDLMTDLSLLFFVGILFNRLDFVDVSLALDGTRIGILVGSTID